MVALYKPRDSREYVMERVLEDLNFACEHCYTSSDWINCARINRYIALAYKAASACSKAPTANTIR